MKKILSVLLSLAVVLTALGMLASCGAVTAASAIKKADEALTKAPYTMTMSMDFASDNAQLNTVFDAMSMEIPVTVDGNNMYMKMSMEVMPGVSASVKMTVFDKVLYYDMAVAGQTVKTKATMSDEDYAEFLKENSAEMPIDAAQFETLTLESKDGKQVITCDGITEEGLKEMNELMGESLSAMGYKASVGDLSYVITLADGKYESMALTAAYSITVEGQTYTVTMTMNAKFSYGDIAPITAPADADKYTETDLDDLLG